MSEERFHIYSAGPQPATRYIDDTHVESHVFTLPPRALVRCLKCNRRRWASQAEAQVYYDEVRFMCAPGHGCKKGKTR